MSTARTHITVSGPNLQSYDFESWAELVEALDLPQGRYAMSFTHRGLEIRVSFVVRRDDEACPRIPTKGQPGD